MALELVGGALLSAFLQVAFEKLASPQALDFFRQTKLDQKLLGKLEIKLHSVQALADDAEQKQFRDPHVRNWLLKVKDVVLDAEDILDEIQYELSKCKDEDEDEDEDEADSESQTCTCKVPNFFKSSPVSSFNKEIKSKMEQVLEDLEYLASQSSFLGLKQASGVGDGSGSQSIVSQKLPSTYLVAESVIYGRDGDKEMIFNWLTSDIDNGNKLSMLSIVGMGGVGKTTLAQHVFNDLRIEGKFDIKAWVCVSDDFTIFKVTKTVLEAITKSTDDSKDLQMVHQRLEEKMKGKKFLLVLDDVWNEKREEWEAVQTPLINFGAQGSKILVTTRSKKVASTMRSKEHHLKQLREDYCWKLFEEHALESANPQPNPDLEEIGMKIVEKCKGLPLALKTMGSLLHNKSVSEWKSVLQSEIWELEDCNIVPALALSYHHLPSHLKRCFAYCALFPKDCLFDKHGLIQFWMAQNFLQCSQQSKSPEEVGEQYFNDLLSRSFFQQSIIGYKTCFVMHDLLNDLAKYVCGDICFRLEVDHTNTIPITTRHCSVAINHVQYFDGFGTLYDTNRLRTFISTTVGGDFRHRPWCCKMSIDELFSKCKFLHVLSLYRYSNLTEVPDSIGNLKHLRSLDLSDTRINILPESTCSLYNLQILKLNRCKHLKELPTNLHKLTHLHHLELIDTELRMVPVHLGKMKNLQVFMSSYVVGENREFSTKQLGELNLLGRLSIEKLQNIENPMDALAVDLKNKTHLVELEVQWDSHLAGSAIQRDLIVIENLQPSKNLEKLSIKNYPGTQFPSWLFDNSLSNVVSLKLDNCQSCLSLPSLGLLPFLKDMKISHLDGIVGIDANFHGSNSCSFTSLETLEFSDMKNWEKWECQTMTGAFPHLQNLSLKNCPKLKWHLPVMHVNLKKLKIEFCEQLLGNFGRLKLDGIGLTIDVLKMEPWLVEWIGQMIPNISLEYLNIHSCLGMNIPMSRCYNFLESLKIDAGCDSLITFPLDFFPILKTLYVHRCSNLQMISQQQAHNYLNVLEIRDCPQFESFPECMHILLPSLEFLSIQDCPKLESFPEGGLPSNLKEIQLYGCSTLRTLNLDRGPNLQMISQQHTYNHLSRLKIRDCPQLESLPEHMHILFPSLDFLSIRNCPKVQSLPDGGLPSNLKEIHLFGCSKLIASLDYKCL